jgi:hypothetical protein
MTFSVLPLQCHSLSCSMVMLILPFAIILGVYIFLCSKTSKRFEFLHFVSHLKSKIIKIFPYTLVSWF